MTGCVPKHRGPGSSPGRGVFQFFMLGPWESSEPEKQQEARGGSSPQQIPLCSRSRGISTGLRRAVPSSIWQDPPLSLVKVEVVDLEASTAGTPRGQLVQRQDSFSSLSPVGRQDSRDSLDSLDSQDRKTGLKRKASFETPSPKKRLFEEGSQALQVRQIEQLKKTIEKDSPAYYRLDYLWGKTPEKEAQPGLKPDTASQRQQNSKSRTGSLWKPELAKP